MARRPAIRSSTLRRCNAPVSVPSRLARATAALRDGTPPDGAADTAQQRLLARLAARPARQARPIRGGLWALAGTACLVLALALLGLPGGGNGQAFAAVQRHLSDFQALRMRIDQPRGSFGTAGQNVQVAMLRSGPIRVDVEGEVSVVVDPVAGQALTLLHGPRQALQFPLPVQDLLGDIDPMAWIAEIRDYQGLADRLPEPRLIGGRTAWGWALEVDGTRVLLWATEDGLPLELTVDGQSLVDIGFEFDPPGGLDPALFSMAVPPGYAVLSMQP
ncbi:MAG: hypothetical protein KF823_03190 [Xanthomonadales bacterium]|nr:hypothetical protein [Xanthomonadales bacterium]